MMSGHTTFCLAVGTVVIRITRYALGDLWDDIYLPESWILWGRTPFSLLDALRDAVQLKNTL